MSARCASRRIAGRNGDLKRALAFEIACTRLNGLPSSQTVVRGRPGSPLDQEHCEHAISHYLGAQRGDFKLQRSAKRRLQGAALDFVAIGQLHR